jgi:hypothetical protein
MSNTKLTLGADPELFMVDAAHAFVSAVGKIGGTKRRPQPLPIGEGFAVQEDNVAVEYNIPASESKAAFNNNIARAMSYLSDRVSQMGLRFVNESAVSFPMAELCTPEAMTFGCDPDYNAWDNGKVNPRPRADDPTLRSCGGHVHVGYTFTSKKDVINFIKHMDMATIGSVLMDKGERRRQLYGKPGAFRYKPYGCEYRSLSNFWVFDSKHTDWVWDATEMALDAWQNNKFDVEANRDLILDAINNGNKAAAKQLIDTYNLLVV